MFDSILVPLDGSETSESILGLVRDRLANPGATIELVTVVEPRLGKPLLDRLEDRSSTESYLSARLHHARLHLERVAGELAAAGFKANGHPVMGSTASRLVELIQKHKPQIVAMTTHGRTGVSRVLRGSVAERLLRHCPVPLMMINPDRIDADLSTIFKRILVPLDGSERSAAILPLAKSLARRFESTIVLAHVDIDISNVPTDLAGTLAALPESNPAQLLEPTERELSDEGLPWESKVLKGHAADRLLAFIEEGDIDLVAMSSHGSTGVERFLLGSVAESVLRRCPVPLVVERHSFAEDAKA